MSDRKHGIVESVTNPSGRLDCFLVYYSSGGMHGLSGMFSMGSDATVTIDGRRVTDVGELARVITGPSLVMITLHPEAALYGLSRQTEFEVTLGPYSGAAPETATSRRQEVIDSVTAFVHRKYGGDWKKAFDAEDEDGDGRLSTGEVSTILAKSGVGVRLTRWAIALEVIFAMDADGDGYVSFDEFQKMTQMKGV